MTIKENDGWRLRQARHFLEIAGAQREQQWGWFINEVRRALMRGVTMREVGEILGLTRQRIAQLKAEAERYSRGFATPDQLAARIAFHGARCWICGAPTTFLDHVKPTSKGGTDWPANIRPCCVSCNSRKNDRWPIDLDWLRRRALKGSR